MYTDEDLKRAVDEGIFSESAVAGFRSYISDMRSAPLVDEENFRLISGFNDIFVVIAAILLLSSAAWVAHDLGNVFAMSVVAVLSWGLAEFFILRRKMSLPSIVLLVSFVGSVFSGCTMLFDHLSTEALMLSSVVSVAAAWIHWKRFHVPITVAAGVASIMVFVVSLLLYVAPGIQEYMLYMVFIVGVLTFYIAMYWDSADLKRVTRKADVAFWLHLLAAPLIVHPVFSNLGIMENDAGFIGVAIVVVLYLLLTMVSLVVDRRAFMVSSLFYVLYALTMLFKKYGLAGDSFAIAGVLIGFSLLLLSGYWHKVRRYLLAYMPGYVLSRVPLAV